MLKLDLLDAIPKLIVKIDKIMSMSKTNFK